MAKDCALNRWTEFFEAEDGRLSMTRLCVFLAFWPASYVVVVTHDVDALGWYLGAFVLGYVGGKFGDGFMQPRSPGAPTTVNIAKTDNLNVAPTSRPTI